ncbi:hypothetical protein DERF_003628 [Dermatophagoides farinae]|uniref:Uncharacterized protein n=1 Tax=Dermatophagoides farinae TaxID=6954 RepID=A0A922IFQ7_DERFA|nr:hypothetical protein DERF_003628 [Dermatophagoides farinae]
MLFKFSIDANVIPNLPHCDLIIISYLILSYMLLRITKIDPLKSLKWEYLIFVLHQIIQKALSLLNKLVNRLHDQNSYELYRAEFMKYVSSGQAVEVNDLDGYFIPHHAVFRSESTSSPVRIVFNASFSRSGRPQEIDDDKLLEMVESNPRQI